jgi:CheY-like chemotaxis protein
MPTILIVDDDSLFRQFMRTTFEDMGYTVLEVDNGDAALSLAETEEIDLMIVDVVMPEKGGIETLMDLHQMHPDQKIIIISGKVPTEADAFRRLVEKFGARVVLQKPFDKESILRAAEKVLAD